MDIKTRVAAIIVGLCVGLVLVLSLFGLLVAVQTCG